MSEIDRGTFLSLSAAVGIAGLGGYLLHTEFNIPKDDIEIRNLNIRGTQLDCIVLEKRGTNSQMAEEFSTVLKHQLATGDYSFVAVSRYPQDPTGNGMRIMSRTVHDVPYSDFPAYDQTYRSMVDTTINAGIPALVIDPIGYSDEQMILSLHPLAEFAVLGIVSNEITHIIKHKALSRRNLLKTALAGASAPLMRESYNATYGLFAWPKHEIRTAYIAKNLLTLINPDIQQKGILVFTAADLEEISSHIADAGKRTSVIQSYERVSGSIPEMPFALYRHE